MIEGLVMYPMLVHDGWVGPRGNHVYQNFTGLELSLSGILEWEEIWEWVALFPVLFTSNLYYYKLRMFALDRRIEYSE